MLKLSKTTPNKPFDYVMRNAACIIFCAAGSDGGGDQEGEGDHVLAGGTG